MQDLQIARTFMLAVEGVKPLYPALVSEKLNGIRCMHVPTRGFFSRTGHRWADGVLMHIQPPADFTYPLDGELYHPELSLQEIMERVSPTHLYPGDGARDIQFHIFDALIPGWGARARYARLKEWFKNPPYPGCQLVEQHDCLSEERMDEIKRDVAARNGEGVMVKSAFFRYEYGRSPALIKVKLWKDAEWIISDLIEGRGKLAGAVGAFRFYHHGQMFEVGTAQLNYEKRRELWAKRDKICGRYIAKVRYAGLSDGGIPLNTSVIAIEEIV